MNLAEFGTRKYPLRCSKLRNLAACSVEPILELLGESVDSAGAGAETGSLTHEAIDAFHKEQRELQHKIIAGLTALRDATKRYPLGDEKEATIYFTHYANDPRNQLAEFLRHPKTGAIGLEHQMEGTLSPHPSDPTGQPIVLTGKADQFRRYRGKNCVMDYKTGKTSAWEMQSVYSYQMAGYLHLANQNGWCVDEAYIIRGYRYRENTAKSELPEANYVFVAMPFVASEVLLILDRIRLEVARIRSGELLFGPSPMCSWCPMKGLSQCIPVAKKKLGI